MSENFDERFDALSTKLDAIEESMKILTEPKRPTKREILDIKNPRERKAAIRENIDLWR